MMLLSVVVPAYREKNIDQDIKKIEPVLKRMGCDYEIIVVDDGSGDGTFERASLLESPTVKVFGYKKNRGKGYAVRFGMARSRGDLVGFIDAGTDIDPQGIAVLVEHLKRHRADAVIGSKYHPESQVGVGLKRKVLSLGTGLLVKILFGLNISDTQAGVKVFRREVLERVLPRLLVKRWAFDIEVLAVAYHLGYRRIVEAPIKLAANLSSNVRVFGPNGIWQTLRDTLAIFYRLKILRYYDDKSKRKWVYDEGLEMRINV
ncbi:glycosyltransferase [Candidatus Parcubacteria bacterium]|nr:glycosyltransferase [Candidatus Parcubacteria bacterium]